MKKEIYLVTTLFIISIFANATTWNYDFGTGTGVYSTNNGVSTTFLPTTQSNGGTARVRVSNNQGGSYNLENAGLASLGTNTELRMVAPTGGSLGKFSIYDYTTASKTFYTKFTILFGNSSGGNTSGTIPGIFYFYQGDGVFFSDNNTPTYTQTFTGIQWVLGASGSITTNCRTASAWTLLSTTAFAQATVYAVEIFGNNNITSNGPLSYTYNNSTYSVASSRQDIWVNGVLIADDIVRAGINNDVNIDSWMFCAESSTSNMASLFVDDIVYANAFPTVPTVSSTAISNILISTADGGGNVTSDGGDAVTARGVCWSTSANPVATGSHTINGTGIGVFTSSLTGLSPNTLYYYRAYATNSAGTSYGSESSFTTSASVVPLINVTGTLTAFTTYEGAPSTSQSVGVVGSNLTATISVSAVAGYEYSTTNAAPWTTTLSLASSFSGTVYIRLTGASGGTPGGTISFTSTGATQVDKSVTGTVTAIPTTQAYSVTFGSVQYNQMTINWSSGNGANRIVKINTTNSFTNPTNGVASGTPNSTYSGSGEQTVYNSNSSTVTVTGLNVSTTYWFRVFEYNGSGATTVYQMITATNNPNSQQTTPTPLINVSPTTLSGFTYIAGYGPSPEQSFTIDASNLVGSLGIAPSINYEISTLTGASFSATNPITLSPTGGAISSTTIYVRLKAGLSANNYNSESITASASGATNKTITCNGSVTGPTITVSPTTLTGFAYFTGSGPSTEQTFTISGNSLTANISIAAATDYEISLSSNSGYTTPLILTPISNTVSSTTIYVRLKAGLAAGSYNSENITASSTGATIKNVACSGTITNQVLQISSTGYTYSQNFDALANTGTSNGWADNTTIAGWYSDRTVYIADNGSSTTGGLHSYGTTSSTDRSLGALSSGSASPYIGVQFYNASSSSIDLANLRISYIGEQWRQTTNSQALVCSYQTSPTQITSITNANTWTNSAGLDFTSPITGTAGTLDGNLTANRITRTDVPIAATGSLGSGQYLMVRWNKTGSTAPGLAIDDFSLRILIPSVTVTGSLSSFNNVVINTTSSEKTYSVSGSNLTANLIVTAPTGFLVSKTTGTGFASSVSFTPTNGTVANSTIFVTFNPTLVQSYSGNITNASSGATTQNVAVSGTGVKGESTNHASNFIVSVGSPAWSVIDMVWDDATGGSVPDGYLVKGSNVSYAAIDNPIDGTPETDAGLVKNILPTVKSCQFTGLSAETTYYFKLFPYTNSGSSINYKIDGTIPSGNAVTNVAPPSLAPVVTVATSITSTGFTANWEAASGASSYRFDLLASNGTDYISGHQNQTINATSYAVSGLDANTTYKYRVRAYNTSGTSSNSELITVTTTANTQTTQTYTTNGAPVTLPVAVDNGVTISTTVDPSSGAATGAITLRISQTAFTTPVPDATHIGKYLNLFGDSALLTGSYIVTFSGVTPDELWQLNGLTWSIIETADFSTPGQVAFSLSATKADVDKYLALNDGNGTLPVELSSFLAFVTPQNLVRLDWITQSETGVSGFYLYRNSITNLNSSELVSPLITATNTSVEQSYSFTDREVQPGKWYYWLQNVDIDGQNQFHGPVEITIVDTDNDTPVIPQFTALQSIYPNPFNPAATIAFGLAKAEQVTIAIYNIRGEKVRSFVSGAMNSGTYRRTWDGTDDGGCSLSSGVYYVRMTAGKYSSVQKAMLIK